MREACLNKVLLLLLLLVCRYVVSNHFQTNKRKGGEHNDELNCAWRMSSSFFEGQTFHMQHLTFHMYICNVHYTKTEKFMIIRLH